MENDDGHKMMEEMMEEEMMEAAMEEGGQIEKSKFEGGEGEAPMMMDDGYVNASGQEMEAIKYQEGHHFTVNRMCFMLFNFLLLLMNNFIFKNEQTTKNQRYICVVVFTLAMIYLTSVSVNRVKRIHEVKE